MVNGSLTDRLSSPLQWYAVLGAPLAWAVQLVVGYYYTEAACGPSGVRFGRGVETPEAILTVLMAVIAAGGWASAIVLRRATARGEVPDPLGRVRFIADVGLVVGAIFVAVIVYTGAGEMTLAGCP
jgi:hypothetical protein